MRSADRQKLRPSWVSIAYDLSIWSVLVRQPSCCRYHQVCAVWWRKKTISTGYRSFHTVIRGMRLIIWLFIVNPWGNDLEPTGWLWALHLMSMKSSFSCVVRWDQFPSQSKLWTSLHGGGVPKTQ
ncbi:hypothetical protein BT96DRAFT_626432 [Gymnopus androsaceus JB14]|uniref:Uncharacterized protein n=1 Tax=Gymnopus androsaceus JB14 TaxID=1447944 RepID=A0A6A4IE82_9AGAR|nr:hypothetical protein BT96DRAFT_626432 [Gymnopus androsaceus JB14]